jgi:hypothetical protein
MEAGNNLNHDNSVAADPGLDGLLFPSLPGPCPPAVHLELATQKALDCS